MIHFESIINTFAEKALLKRKSSWFDAALVIGDVAMENPLHYHYPCDVHSLSELFIYQEG